MSGLSKTLFSQFNVHLEGDWQQSMLDLLYDASDNLFSNLIPSIQSISWINNLVIRTEDMPQLGLTSKGLIRYNPNYLTSWTIVHEFAHAWDYTHNLNLSWRMLHYTRSWGPIPILHGMLPENPAFWYHPGSPPPPCGKDKNFNRLEDFAETVTAYVFPEEAKIRAVNKGMPYEQYGYDNFFATPRGRFINLLINETS